MSAEDLFGRINFDDIFGATAFGFDGGLFDRLFHRAPAGPRRGADVEMELEVPLKKVAEGGKEKVHLTHPQICPDCRGSGAKPGTSPRACEKCKGTGREVTSSMQKNVVIQRSRACAVCGGRGSIIDQPCPRCIGAGQSPRDETIEISIPPGMAEGTVMRVRGKGMASPEPSGPSGDVYVRMVTAPDPRFTRAGVDLWHEEVIAVTAAVLGTQIVIPTLEGTASVRIPPGIQTVLRLKGKGLPEFRGKGKGDLLARIGVRIPAHLTGEERDLYRKLQLISSTHDD